MQLPSIMFQLLIKNANERLPLLQVMKHPWIVKNK